jgi:quinoprotein glucose dehydrogenase
LDGAPRASRRSHLAPVSSNAAELRRGARSPAKNHRTLNEGDTKMATYDVTSQPSSPHQRNWAVTILGWVCAAFGLVIFAGGAWLITLGGSWYYGLAGLGLIGTGVLLNYQKLAAVWLYLLVWIGTLGWSWWEVGADWWAEAPRIVAPTLILVLILMCIPALARRR